IVYTAGGAKKKAGERELLAIETIEASGDEQRQGRVDIADCGEINHKRTSEKNCRGEWLATLPFEEQRRGENDFDERHQMCRCVTGEHVQRYAEQLVELGEE